MSESGTVIEGVVTEIPHDQPVDPNKIIKIDQVSPSSQPTEKLQQKKTSGWLSWFKKDQQPPPSTPTLPKDAQKALEAISKGHHIADAGEKIAQKIAETPAPTISLAERQKSPAEQARDADVEKQLQALKAKREEILQAKSG